MSERIAAAGVAFVAAVLATRLAERWSRQHELLDVPNDRSSHAVPTPRLGGLGIIAGTLAGLATFALMPGATIATEPVGPAGSIPPLPVIVVAGLLLGLVGLVDDVRRTSVLAKYLSQLAAAVVVSASLQPELHVDFPGVDLEIGGLAAVATAAVWLTALINAFNFMDGIDGLVGGVALAIGLIGLGLVSPAVAPLLIVVAAACAGFLTWNIAPASIFMGDVGSQFLGLVVASALLGQSDGTVEVIPVLLVASPFLLDTGFTLVRRARAGRDLLSGHREHLYQRLVVAGRTHREVAAGYVAATIAAGAVALAWRDLALAPRLGVVMALAIAGAGYIRWVSDQERRSGERAA